MRRTVNGMRRDCMAGGPAGLDGERGVKCSTRLSGPRYRLMWESEDLEADARRKVVVLIAVVAAAALGFGLWYWYVAHHRPAAPPPVSATLPPAGTEPEIASPLPAANEAAAAAALPAPHHS